MWSQLNQQQQTQNQKSKLQILSKLDQLDLGKWHIFISLALGLVWLFDGYEVTLISLYRFQIQQQSSQATFKTIVSAYQLGGIAGSIIFGILAFIVGRRNIFTITLSIYFVGVLLSGVQTSWPVFILARFITGVSVGGQFTAIFTAVDQFLPPKYRGRVNIGIDGTWHFGGTIASLLTMLVGNTEHWRIMFLFGWIGIFALIIMRRNMPESPRWLILKKRQEEAIKIIDNIQSTVRKGNFLLQQIQQMNYPSSQESKSFSFYFCEIIKIVKDAVSIHTRKFLVSFILIFCQAFFFNQIYYQFPDILAKQYKMDQTDISKYTLPISLITFLSTLLIGPLFDEVGRRKLLLLTYVSAAVLAIISYHIKIFLWRQIFMILIFIFASPASSSANLIASEVFPTSSRTIVLFIMFVFSMLGGMAGVWVNHYVVSSVLMAFAGIFAFIFCPDSEKKTLEQIQKL